MVGVCGKDFDFFSGRDPCDLPLTLACFFVGDFEERGLEAFRDVDEVGRDGALGGTWVGDSEVDVVSFPKLMGATQGSTLNVRWTFLTRPSKPGCPSRKQMQAAYSPAMFSQCWQLPCRQRMQHFSVQVNAR